MKRSQRGGVAGLLQGTTFIDLVGRKEHVDDEVFVLCTEEGSGSKKLLQSACVEGKGRRGRYGAKLQKDAIGFVWLHEGATNTTRTNRHGWEGRAGSCSKSHKQRRKAKDATEKCRRQNNHGGRLKFLRLHGGEGSDTCGTQAPRKRNWMTATCMVHTVSSMPTFAVKVKDTTSTFFFATGEPAQTAKGALWPMTSHLTT